MVDVFCYGAVPPTVANVATVRVAMFDAPKMSGDARIGGPVINAVRRLGVKPSVRSFDLLSVAMAVTAADTFVSREKSSDVAWGRVLNVSVPLAEPAAFAQVTSTLEAALGFLTGDQWKVEFRSGGRLPPEPQMRGDVLDLRRADSVCLFSGGLDSAIGVIDMAAAGKSPVLVSHSYPSDKARQEEIQNAILSGLPRFSCVAHPRWKKSSSDTTMRGRSFDFLAMAALTASAVQVATKLERIPLIVPENGFIAINAPLSIRRVGSLSTRTTHPHYLALMQQIFDGLQLGVDIDNPYGHSTKGEMLRNCSDPVALAKVAARTVSCGKWKRSHKQCGRCVPCLIRRLSFHSAGMPDPTTPPYRNPVLLTALNDEAQRADILALSGGVAWLEEPRKLASRVGASGPLPPDPGERAALQSVVERGLIEARDFFLANSIPV